MEVVLHHAPKPGRRGDQAPTDVAGGALAAEQEVVDEEVERHRTARRNHFVERPKAIDLDKSGRQ